VFGVPAGGIRFIVAVNALQMPAYGGAGNIIQHSRHFLRQPDVFVLITHFNGGRIVAGNSFLVDVHSDIEYLFHWSVLLGCGSESGFFVPSA
jgi:hypothetical protein